MEMKFWKQTKIYHTDLSADEINAVISKGLGTKQILFLKPINIGTSTINNFNYTAFRPGRIVPVKIKATFRQEKTGTILNVEYKASFNPWFILIPIWAFFILIASVDNFTLNGEQVSKSTQVFFSMAFMLVVSLFIVLSTIAPIRTEKVKLETTLKLN